MPIPDERLLSDLNAHILVPATYTIRQALAAWQKGHPHFGRGREWWWLIIDYNNGTYTAIPLEQVRDLLSSPRFHVDAETRLSNLPSAQDNPDDWSNPLPGIVAARVIDQDAYSSSAAIHLAENSAGNLLVVLKDGKFAGIINKRMRNFAMASQSLLDLYERMQEDTVPVKQTRQEDTKPGELDSRN